MGKIDNNFLKNYLTLDREVKEKSKQLVDMKDKITKELKIRKGKSIITRYYIAIFQLMKRKVYKIPDEIKEKYRQPDKECNILKVIEKKAMGDVNETTNHYNRKAKAEKATPSPPPVKGLK